MIILVILVIAAAVVICPHLTIAAINQIAGQGVLEHSLGTWAAVLWLGLMLHWAFSGGKESK